MGLMRFDLVETLSLNPESLTPKANLGINAWLHCYIYARSTMSGVQLRK